ncbi:activity-regulated cytoskeleton-associated protein-like [Rhipicephalus sanguineus]|uniref:activity-regulated cytoskeleton-associated protein-like n=1 Tax=Rhipicephalus sanguineus TaxID=34632 RepID=UPI001894325A|nr:activity-regulated cytoskeleton-associated protein-like [Rhipicephalus sanguineus]
MIGSPLGARERSPDPQRLEPGELTPVHQRANRRLRGDPPEFGPLPTAPATQASSTANERTMASPVTSELIVSPPCMPEPFHDDTYEDVEDWLEHFERVANINGWDEARKLSRMYFALEDAARTWYENHEAVIPTWQEFRRHLVATYASTDRREKAENALQSRNQRTNESVGMYIEDMSRLFRRADPNMTEEKKLRHLMRGVKQDLFAGLVRNPPRTVAEFRSEATTIERALQQRSRR